MFSRSEFIDRDVENPSGLLQPLLVQRMDSAFLLLGRIGWRMKFQEYLKVEVGLRLFLPVSPFSHPHFGYRDEGGGVTPTGRAYGGEELCRMVTGYLQGSF